MLISRLATSVSALGTNLVLTRRLGPAEYGLYTVVFTYVFLAQGILGDWGVGTIAVRDASQKPDQVGRIFGTAAAAQLVASLVAYAGLILATRVTHPELLVSSSIAGIPLLFLPVSTLSLVLQVRLKMARLAWANAAGTAANLVFILVAAIAWDGILPLVIAGTCATALRYLLLFNAFRALLPWRALRIDTGYLRPMLLAAWPIMVNTTLLALTSLAPIAILDRLSTPGQVGYFSAANKVASQLGVFPAVLFGPLLPIFARMSTEDRPRLRALVSDLVRVLLVLAIAMGLAGVIWGASVTSLLFGERYRPAGAVLGLLTLQTALQIPLVVATTALIAMGKQRQEMLANMATTPLLLLLCVILGSRFGAVGEAGAIAVVALLSLVLMLGWVWRVLGGLDLPMWRLATVLGGGLTVFALGRLLRVPDLLLGVPALGTYAGLLYSVKVLTGDDAAVLASVAPRSITRRAGQLTTAVRGYRALVHR